LFDASEAGYGPSVGVHCPPPIPTGDNHHHFQVSRKTHGRSTPIVTDWPLHDVLPLATWRRFRKIRRKDFTDE
jgi:hypothetical protein